MSDDGGDLSLASAVKRHVRFVISKRTRISERLRRFLEFRELS
jgi:hypothetical protein